MALIGVVIPAFRASESIMKVLDGIGPEVSQIVVVDDACPERTADVVEANCSDDRVSVTRNPQNLGVGGATKVGYEVLLKNSEILYFVKLDADGQMDPRLIRELVAPLERIQSDYTKGNRFSRIEDLEQMPKLRLVGNSLLSLLAKFSSGYWDCTDPNNGFTAIRRGALEKFNLSRVANGWFFETDILFRLSILRAVVIDVPMAASYGSERSNLKEWKVAPLFLRGHLRNYVKRILYKYYLLEWNIASFELPLGLVLFWGGLARSLVLYSESIGASTPTPIGTIMVPALLLIFGFQLLLSALNHDVASPPRRPLGSLEV